MGYNYKREARLITEVFKTKKIRARAIVPPILTPTFVMYRIMIDDSESIDRVEKSIKHIALKVSNVRKTAVHARFSANPLFIEFPAVEPRTLYWDDDRKIVPHTMVMGRGYQLGSGTDQVIDFRKTFHVLIGGMTGSGKSVMLQNLILSLTRGTGPGDLRLVLVDLKLDDLVPFRNLPHTAFFAGDEDAAEHAVEIVHDELIRRRNSLTAKRPYRLVLVIDELSLLPDAAKETLKKITSLGRSIWVNVIAATQTPSAEVIGGTESRNNFTTRLGGRVADATASNIVLGRGEMGAQFLPGNGAFIRVEGPDVIRLQTFYTAPDVVESSVARTARMWANVTVAPVKGAETKIAQGAGKTKNPEPLIRSLDDVFREFFDGESMRDGWIAEAIRTRFGDAAALGGRNYPGQRDAVQSAFEEWIEEQNREREYA